MSSIAVARLNHAVPYVRDLDRAVDFYAAVSGLEIMWRVPREQWGELESEAVVAPLDLEGEVRRHGCGAPDGAGTES